jgi:hypothetical protein
MAVTSVAAGSKTADGNEQTLEASNLTAAGSYVLCVDLVNMVLGDAVELRVKTKARSTGTLQTVYFATYANAQTQLNVYSVPVPIDGTESAQISFTLKQTAGTNRAYPWNVMTL